MLCAVFRPGRFAAATLSVFLVSVVAGLAGCGREAAFAPPPPPKVVVEHPVLEPVVVYREAPGRIEAAEQVSLLARVRGFVEAIEFVDGQFVEQGQVVFRIEPGQYQAQVKQAEAALASANAALALAGSTLAKVQQAVAADAASPVELAEAEARRDQAAAEVASADARLDQARLDLGYTEVVAPFAGRISESAVDVGDFVDGQAGTALATVQSLDPIFVYWNASERAVLAFKAQGRPLPVSTDGREIPEQRRIAVTLRLADDSVYGHAGYIDYVAPAVDPATGTLRIRARVPNPDAVLFPGQFARVMTVAFEGDAVRVPESAVGRDVVGPYLMAVDGQNVVQRRDVTLGDLQGDRRIVLEGIGPGDRVVTLGVQRARPGRPVDPQAPAQETEAGQPGA